MYLKKQSPEQKDDYLSKAFADYTNQDLDVVKACLTDDDIDAVQQYAIWYFTNRDSDEFNVTTLPAVTLTGINDDLTTYEGVSYRDLNKTGSEYRQDMANHLYQYLINSAITGTTETVTYPSIAETTPVSTENEDYYVLGPYKVNSGTAAKTQYSIKLLDQSNNEISRNDYQILIDGETNFTDKNINEIFDTNYYIYIPKTNTTTTNVLLELSYSSFDTKVSLWKNKTTNDQGVEVYQPVALVTRGETPHKVTVPVEIIRTEKKADLALRKYIVKVNNTNTNRAPKVDVTNLKNGTSTTAEYKHQKSPVSVSEGDTIVYEIRVYNEGDVDATGVVIVDALPAGLEYVEDSEINNIYGWTVSNTGTNRTVYTTNYLENTTIGAFDKENSDTLESAYVQIECKISENSIASSVLTNVAEIADDDITDRDSDTNNNDYIQNDLDSSNYTGDKNNKTDLTDQDYFYKGRQDDDDFEKVQIEGKTFDLSLQKFITKVNGSAPAKSRVPEVDVTELKAGASDATYTTVKTPLTVEQGDIITYTIRVYNEGELAGYAEEVSDYLPEGLGFLVNHTTNIDNYWSIPTDSKTVKLNTITNGTKNLSADDFNGVDSLAEVDVVIGSAKLTSTKLKSSTTDEKNLIKAFDKETSDTLDYRDIEITCIVLVDKVNGYNFRNIAEITDDSDENREEILDIDSTPNTVDPDNYPGEDENQDDNDYENLTTTEEEIQEFDLSLQKFITGLNGGEVTGREPTVSINSEGKIQFSSTVDPLQVENNDVITYTIRVYNEGNTPGYAKEVSDDLPEGLEYLPDNDINKKYGWVLYDKDGNETTDLNQAVTVKTDYLSKEKSEERGEDCLLKAFDSKAPDYRDVQIAFKVVESEVKTSERIIKNIAEITDDEDENGNPIKDIDSIPGNNKDGEDDIDDEKVYVKYFDLALKKDLIKVIITEDGTTREISLSSDSGLQKVEIHRKKLNSTTVKFVYNITVTNEGQIAGTATEITDYIPEGLEFITEENKQWTQVSERVITTNALSTTVLEPGQSASVQVVLKWINSENNLGLKVNVAEISADHNDSNTPDIDSTPNNRVEGEDDIDNAEIYLGISTGTAPTYIALSTVVIAIMATGVMLIKKYVL